MINEEEYIEKFYDSYLRADGPELSYGQWLEYRLMEARLSLEGIEDMLVVAGIDPPSDYNGDYKAAVNKLITWNMQVDKFFDEQERLEKFKSDEQKRFDALHFSSFPIVR